MPYPDFFRVDFRVDFVLILRVIFLFLNIIFLWLKITANPHR